MEGLKPDDRPIETFVLDKATLRALINGANKIQTVGQLREALITMRAMPGIGPKRREYLERLFAEEGAMYRRSWTDVFYKTVFPDVSIGKHYGLSIRGEQRLCNRIVEWLHNLSGVDKMSADPAYILCARIGCGRIIQEDPDEDGKYRTYEPAPTTPDGRHDDVSLRPEKLAGICNVSVGTINTIYRNALLFLRREGQIGQILEIYTRYAEDR